MFIKVRHKILLHNFVEFRDAQSNAQSYLRKDSRMFLASFYLILQTSLVTKLGGHHHNYFDSQSDRVLKILTHGPFIFRSRPLKLPLQEKKIKIFSVRVYDQQTFTILYVLNAVVSYLDSVQSPPTKFLVTKTTSFTPRRLKFN